MHAQAADIAQAEGGDAMNHAYEGDLHLIMMAVQKLVDEIIRPNEMGQYAYTPAILDRMQGAGHRVSHAQAAATPRLFPLTTPSLFQIFADAVDPTLVCPLRDWRGYLRWMQGRFVPDLRPSNDKPPRS